MSTCKEICLLDVWILSFAIIDKNLQMEEETINVQLNRSKRIVSKRHCVAIVVPIVGDQPAKEVARQRGVSLDVVFNG